jgi:hypothetical protein
MVTALGWRRRRDYEQLFRGLERLGEFRDIDNFDAYEALAAVRSVSIHFELLREDTARYFEGRFRRAGGLTHSAMLLSVRQASIDRAQKRRAHNLGSTFLQRGIGVILRRSHVKILARDRSRSGAAQGRHPVSCTTRMPCAA